MSGWTVEWLVTGPHHTRIRGRAFWRWQVHQPVNHEWLSIDGYRYLPSGRAATVEQAEEAARSAAQHLADLLNAEPPPPVRSDTCR